MGITLLLPGLEAVRIFHPLVKYVKIITGKLQRVTEMLENKCKTLTDNKENSILFSTAAPRCNCFTLIRTR